ncbi:hypothetical protein ACFFRR_003111 [Megaselia abdita]
MMKIGIVLFSTFLFIGSSVGLSCIQCNSSHTPECTVVPSQVNTTCESKNCFDTQNSDTKEVVRGCYTEQSSSVCKLPDCKICDFDRCNTKAYNIDCLLCESPKDENCKTELHLIKSSCESTACFASINRGTGEVHRGCKEDTSACPGVNDCQIYYCDKQRCNTQKLPITTCLNCMGPDCVDPDPSVVDTMECEGGNKCITKYNDKGQVFRGCTQVPDEKCPDGEACRICESDKCNFGKFPFQEPATLSCMKCDSSQGQFCSENDLVSGVPQKCEGTYNFHEKEACYVNIRATSIERGCFFELNSDDRKECLTKGECRVCHSEGCNRYDNIIEYPGYKCHVCDNCEKIAGRNPLECSPMPTNKNGGPGCFVNRNDDGTVSRNCLSSSDCSGNKCVKCNEDSCNTMDAPGKGSALIGVKGLIGVLVVLSYKIL